MITLVVHLHRLLKDPATSKWTHLMWIDADAAVVRQHKKLEEFLQRSSPDTELVVGEDQCVLVHVHQCAFTKF